MNLNVEYAHQKAYLTSFCHKLWMTTEYLWINIYKSQGIFLLFEIGTFVKCQACYVSVWDQYIWTTSTQAVATWLDKWDVSS